MGLFRTILFAADLLEDSEGAFDLACLLAGRERARLVVLHVAGPARGPAMGPHHIDSLKKRLSELYVPRVRTDIVYEVREGDPSSEVLRMSQEVSADVIVMGTHGRSRLRRMLAGSVAESVLHEARCAVMVLRSHEGRRLPEKAHVILHPIAVSATWKYTLCAARRAAEELGARLIVVHVSPRSVLLDGSLTAPIELEYYRHFLEEVRKQLEGSDLKHSVDIRMNWGNVADEILSTARETGSDLIVMGVHARSCPGQCLMGNVVEPVLQRAHCPVLLIKAPEQEPSALSEFDWAECLDDVQRDERPGPNPVGS